IVVQLQQPERRVGPHLRVRHTIIVVRSACTPTGLVRTFRCGPRCSAGQGALADRPVIDPQAEVALMRSLTGTSPGAIVDGGESGSARLSITHRRGASARRKSPE